MPSESMMLRDAGCDELPSAEAVLQQLGQILRSPEFMKAPSLSQFLRFAVEQTLQGKGGVLKEYSIGVQVFGRGDSFDPATDNIVRVQARRLRAKLAQYYEREGHNDPVEIDFPKGKYAPLFRMLSAPVPGYVLQFVRHAGEAGSRTGETSAGTPAYRPLPAWRTSLIGREEDLKTIGSLLLSGDARLITLTGAGGSGKTRLAIQAATEVRGEFAGGVCFVPLASITDCDTVVLTIAQALGVRYTGGRTLTDALEDHLAAGVHAPTLLLIDNFEQVLEAAPIVALLLESCGMLKVLVTSRAALRVYGEFEHIVAPLETPDPQNLPPLHQLGDNPAVALFVRRAAAVCPGLTLTEDNARAIAGICARVDGLPLAIELAAARARVLTPGAMLERFSGTLELLTEGPRDVPARQRTLRNTIDWSHRFLSAGEQKLFRRLAIFAGGCTLESAEAVCNVHVDLEADLVATLWSLVDKNLLHRTADACGVPRFAMLQTVREYAGERLTESDDTDVTRLAHAGYCIVLAEEGLPRLSEHERAEWLATCDAEHENLRAGLDWLIETGRCEWALRLASALYSFWEAREHLTEARERLQAVLAMPGQAGSSTQRARALMYAGNATNMLGDFEEALRFHREGLHISLQLGDRQCAAATLSGLSNNARWIGDLAGALSWAEQYVAICRDIGDPKVIAGAMSNFGVLVNEQGDYSRARRLFQEALSIFKDLNDTSGAACSINHLGDVARSEGNFAEAKRLYAESAAGFRSTGDQWGEARSLIDLGSLASEQNDPESARVLLRQALRLFVDLGYQRGVARILEVFACAAVREGRFERALTLSGAAHALRHRLGVPARPSEQARLLQMVDPAWRALDPVQARAAWANAAGMSLDEAVSFAVEAPEN